MVFLLQPIATRAQSWLAGRKRASAWLFPHGPLPWHQPGRAVPHGVLAPSHLQPSLKEEQGAALGLLPRDVPGLAYQLSQLPRWLLVAPIEFHARYPLPGLRGWR